MTAHNVVAGVFSAAMLAGAGVAPLLMRRIDQQWAGYQQSNRAHQRALAIRAAIDARPACDVRGTCQGVSGADAR